MEVQPEEVVPAEEAAPEMEMEVEALPQEEAPPKRFRLKRFPLTKLLRKKRRRKVVLRWQASFRFPRI
ncbi:hypothetical protein [Thermococcus sp. JCM 11816]|uniref:hypothetical protein n=1 Tax=Thermococcus sp. (strain JCM 11816 / KS-1) TaxID=1295125 RepID=UPI000A4CA4A0